MKKFRKLIGFLLSLIMVLQTINLSVVFADENRIFSDDDVISDAGVSIDNYNINTFSTSSEKSNDNALQDIVLVLDDSGSMSYSQMNTLKEASIKFCESILKANTNNRIGIVAFSKNEIYDFSSDIEDLKANLNSLYAYGGTPIHRGITSADDMFNKYWKDNSIKSIVIMSDGEPDSENSAKLAYDNISDKYKIYSVYFGNDSTARNFMKIIQNSGFYTAEDVESLIEQFGKIADVILNPVQVVITHERKYNFFEQEYVIKAVLKNPNNKPVNNIQLNLELPKNENVELADGESALKTIQALDGQTSQEISWDIVIMQEQENKAYNIVLKINSDELISMNVEHQIFVDGYNNGNLRLNFSKDTWKFKNYSSKILNVDKGAFNGLLQTVDNVVKEDLKSAIKTFGKDGHCYGMAATAILAKTGETSPSQISNGANTIHDIDLVAADETISYYHLSQILPGIKEERTKLIGLSTAEQLEKIANKARLVSTGGTPVLLGFALKNGAGGHAVVCYDYQHMEESVEMDGNQYNSYLLIYDSNFPNNKAMIYFNSNVDENSKIVTVNDNNYLYLAKDPMDQNNDLWLIIDNIDYFKYAINDISIINLKDLENMSNNYTAWLRVKTYTNMKRLEVHNNNFNKFLIGENGALDSNVIGFFDDCNLNSDNKYYNVKLSNNQNYSICAEDLSEFDISLMYSNYYLAVKADNAKEVNFDNDGSVQLKDNMNIYSLKLTANDGYTSLPWYTVTVEGEKAENPSLQITDEGYLFEGEELSNIKVVANNDTETKELTFNSDKSSVLITNDAGSLAVKEDSDNDGIYDKVIANSDNKTTEEITTDKNYHSSGAGASSLKVINYDEKTTVENTTEATTEVKTDKNKVEFKKVRVTIGDKNIVIDDKNYTMDVAPYIQAESNSTLVPLRFVALALSGNDIENADNSTVISWNSETKTATIKANDKIVEFTAGSDTMTVDGKSKLMENGVKAEITDGRMFVPFRALGNALGVDVTWDSTTKTATYSYK